MPKPAGPDWSGRDKVARAALAELGFGLVLFGESNSDGDRYGILSATSSRRFDGRCFATIEDVEQFIADERAREPLREQLHRHSSDTEDAARYATTAAAQIAWMNGYINRTYGDAVPSVIPGRLVRTKPYVGQAVHYVSRGSADGKYPSVCRAATVTHIHEQDEPGLVYVALCVMNPEGLFFNAGVKLDPGTYTGGERRTSVADGPLPLITCDDLTFKPATWHFISEAP